MVLLVLVGHFVGTVEGLETRDEGIVLYVEGAQFPLGLVDLLAQALGVVCEVGA
jgi:hypothetical protein